MEDSKRFIESSTSKKGDDDRLTDMEYMSRVYCATWNLDNDNGELYIRGISEALHTLSEREQLALELRYREGMTYKLVGQKIGGVSIQRARCIVQLAMRKLRHLPPGIYMSVSQIVEMCDELKNLVEEKNAMINKQQETIMDQRAVIAKKEVMIKENKLQISLLQNEIQLSQRRQDTVINKQFGTSPLKIETMSFSSRTYNALMAEGITTCSALLAYTSFNDLSRIRNIGTTTLLDIANKMYSYGFCDWVNKTLVNTTGKLREIIQRGLDNRNGMF